MPFKLCFCGKGEKETYRVLDYSHGNLINVPTDIYEHAPTLEELYLDANQIKDLPKALFNLHHLKLLNIGDNEIISLPSNVGNLVNVAEFDISKNGFLELPDTIKGMKSLEYFDLSVNPIGRLPDGFTMLQNLTQVFLNDTFLDFLPANIGRMVKLEILEVRDNHLTTIPKSMNRLQELKRLDIGNNEFIQLPEVVGTFTRLEELWIDGNKIQHIPSEIGDLKYLKYLDVTENCLEWIAEEIGDCSNLTDLHLTTNNLVELPENICKLNLLETLKVDDNRLTHMPTSLGGLSNLQDLVCSGNELETLPPGIGLLRKLENLNADENYIEYLPDEICSCIGLTVISLRQNRMQHLPDDIGRLSNTTVLNISSNVLEHLPYSLMKLKKLKALWLSENQVKPLIPLQTDWDQVNEKYFLTCYMFPQRPVDDLSEKAASLYEEKASFHQSLFEEEWKKRTSVLFDVDDDVPEVVRLTRQPTPFPKDIRDKINQFRNHAIAKGQITANHNNETIVTPSVPAIQIGGDVIPSNNPQILCDDIANNDYNELAHPFESHTIANIKTAKNFTDNISEEELLLKKLEKTRLHNSDKEYIQKAAVNDCKYVENMSNDISNIKVNKANFPLSVAQSPHLNNRVYHDEDAASEEGIFLVVDSKKHIKLSSDSGLGSGELMEGQSIWKNGYPAIPEQEDRFRVTIKKTPHLGFSVCGGIDVPDNCYKPNDFGIYVTKVLAGGPAFSLLKAGDKILEVNGVDFSNIRHEQAVSILKSGGQVELLILRIRADHT